MEEYGVVHEGNCGFGSMTTQEQDHDEYCGAVVEGDHHHHHHHHVMTVEELLAQGCWVETISTSDEEVDSSLYLPLPTWDHHHQGINNNKRYWWIGPNHHSSSSSSSSCSSVKDRLVLAVAHLKEYNKCNKINNNLLIHIWVPPVRTTNHHHLLSINTTTSHDSSSVSLTGFPPTSNQNPSVIVRFFRMAHYAQQQYFDARNNNGSLGLIPVFERGSSTCLGVLHILFTNHTSFFNYPPPPLHNASLEGIVDYRSCQNLITTTPPPPPAVKVFEELYSGAVNEMMEVLTSVCKTHTLPLALTWAPCLQQPGAAKCGCGHSTTSTTTSSLDYVVCCVSTVDSACFVADLDMLGFQEACSEYHLFRGQGIVGTAFSTSKPCFATDITAFSKAEYPLSHHAQLFGLHAAVAIPLRGSTSLYSSSAPDFVLEFFLPKDCHDPQQQRHLLHSLSVVVQQSCRTLHVVTGEEEEVEVDQFFTLPHYNNNNNNYMIKQDDDVVHIHHPSISHQQQQQQQVEACTKDQTSSWIAHMMEAQQKGKAGVCVSLEYQLLDQDPKEEFKVTTNWNHHTSSEHEQQQQDHQQHSGSVFSDFRHQVVLERSSTVEGVEESHTFGGGRRPSSGGRKPGEKRRTKAEKTISLPVLRQYFAGSLKDAAKSIGVCPTTLKRICRQHGITRWPSRKIKKVGHSLKKLQLVIDSVQGAEGAIQIGSFYSSFPELSSATAAATATSNSHSSNSAKNNTLYAHSYGDHGVTQSAASSHTFGNQQHSTADAANAMTETHVPDAFMLRRSDLAAEDTKQHLTTTRTLPPNCDWNSQQRGAFRVKATFADEKIRFSLQPVWGLAELQLEIARRFNLKDVTSNMVLKYLDDDGEWVVLACDADLEECKDLHRSSQTRTIRLSLFQASPLNLPPNTFASTSSPS